MVNVIFRVRWYNLFECSVDMEGLFVAKCSMCRRSFDTMDNFLIEGKPICKECAKKLNDLVESNDRKTVESAFNYIYTCREQSSDQEVSDFLQDILENNASAMEDFAVEDKKKRDSEPVRFDEQSNFFADREKTLQSHERPTISSVFSAFAWITWICGFVCAIVVAINIPAYGFAWFIGICAGCLVSGSIPMAIAEVINYLAQIAENTSQSPK